MSDRVKCNCKTPAAAYQESLYGQGVRVATQKQNGDLVCTVCGKVNNKGAK